MHVILKATTACNGSCRYCAAAPGGEGAETMSPDRLGPLFDAFADWLVADEKRRLGFIWHGGEPMLPGLDFFRHANAEQTRVFGDDRARVTNRLQSNLALLTDAWIPFLKGFVAGIGTSYDIVDGVRGLKNGEDLSGRWVGAVEACRDAGIPVGVVYVVHRRSLTRARDLYHFFRNLDGRGRVRFNPLYPEGLASNGGGSDLALTPEDYGRFLVEVAELWFDDDCRATLLPLTEWARAWVDPAARLSCDSSGACQRSLLGVSPDGSAWGCGRVADHADPAWRLGNVFDDPLETILEGSPRLALDRRVDALRGPAGACTDCAYWRLCHGGCPMLAALVHDDPMCETPFCEARKAVFRVFEQRLGPPAIAQQDPRVDLRPAETP